MTTVVRCNGKTYAELTADPGVVYVGRAVPRRGYPESDWHNPFKSGMPPGAPSGPPLDASGVVRMFARYLMTREDLLARLGELRGKQLACWCVEWDGTGEPPAPCHAVVLARFADEPALAAKGV